MRAAAGTLLMAVAAGMTALLAQPAAASDGAGGALVKDDKVHLPTSQSLDQAGTAVGTSFSSLTGRHG